MFRGLLNETKGFKYQITVKLLLKKYKHNGEIKFASVYFNSLTKTVINHRFRLENSFQENLYMIDVWINNGSGWDAESVESQYINISTYRPLSESFYMELPVELRSPRKDGKQSVKLEKGIIEFKNYFKQIPVSFKIYAACECNLRGAECYEGPCTKKYQDHIPCSFAYKVVCIDDRFTQRIVVYRV